MHTSQEDRGTSTPACPKLLSKKLFRMGHRPKLQLEAGKQQGRLSFDFSFY